jgi:hypothetical protein
MPAPVQLRKLIKDTARILDKYKTSLTTIPSLDSLESLPHLPNRKLIQVPDGISKVAELPEDERKEAEKRLRERTNILAAHYPFDPAYGRPDVKQAELPGQRIARELCTSLDGLVPQLKSYFQKRNGELQNFVFSSWGSSFDRALDSREIIQLLTAQIDRLQAEKRVAIRNGTFPELRDELAVALDNYPGDHTAASQQMKLDRGTLEGFLNGDIRRPRRKTQEKFEKFIERYGRPPKQPVSLGLNSRRSNPWAASC